jgi:ribosome-binding factor A
MPTRRQERMARLIKEVVSEAILSHLSDPRITGIVTVTRVTVTPDMRNADVYVSIYAASDSEKDRTFEAITHARARIQGILAGAMHSKFCPTLRLHRDEQFQKMLETMRLIQQVSGEHQDAAGGPSEPDLDEPEEPSETVDDS